MMAEALVTSADPNSSQHGLMSDGPSPSSDGSLFHRRIEFHQAKKAFTGFSSKDCGGFQLEILNPTSSVPQRPAPGSDLNGRISGPGGKRQEGLESIDTGLYPELRHDITFKRIGAGLQNLGNTCFLNSVLQCLTYTEPLAAYLTKGKHRQNCRTAGFCALCAIQKHVNSALETTGRSLAPKDLVSNLRCISRNFRNARQEDAHEYMVNLLESMHKCCLPSGIPSESPIAYDKSLVHKIFGGRLRSQVKCMQCSSCSNKFDPFLDLSLEINKADSIEKALTNFTAKEYLDGGEKQYQCQKCKQKVKALKQLTVHKAPDVLTVHLKRFSALNPGQKIIKNIHFGPTLDLKPFVSGNYDGNLKYTLYGVLVHHGSNTHSGHYYSFVRTSSGLWYSLDDHQVRQVSEKMVLAQKAYMLFYVREGRNCAPKQPVKVVQRENTIMTRVNSSRLIKETVQIGPIDKKINEYPSTAVTQGASSIKNAVTETHLTEASNQKTNSIMITESSALKKDDIFDVSFQPAVPMEAVTGLSVLQPNGGGPSTRSVPLKDFDIFTKNPIVAVPDGKSNPCNNEITSKIEQRDLVVLESNCCSHQDSVVDAELSKHDEVKYTEKNKSDATRLSDCNGHINYAAADVMEKSSLKIGDGAHSQNSDGKSKGTNSVKHSGHPKPENAMVKASSMQNNHGQDVERTRITKSTKVSGVQTAQFSAQHNIDHKCLRKLRKRRKCQITSIFLSSGLLLGASLSIRKKKHKRVKRRAIKVKNLTQEDFLDGKAHLKEFGPSTSEFARPLPIDGSVHPEQASKSNSSEMENAPTADSNLVGGNDEEFKSRLGQNGAVLATEKQPKRSSSSSLTGTQWDDRVNGSNSMQNGLMSMLTRDLEETVVARWDGIDLPSSLVTGSSGVDALKIGYVADEWDEEYDRGKRKKVRDTKDLFGGPNLFQQIATKKAKTKHTQTKQRDSGNQPFRI